MPSIVYQSPGMSSRRLALVSQSVQEQLTGLVNVSLEYVTTADSRDRVAATFYLDAPPPIWPDSVNQFELQNRALYMVSRNITQANGLVTISAEYAGGLKRGGSSPLLITTERDGPKGYSFVGDRITLTIQTYNDSPFGFTPPGSTGIGYSPSEFLSYYATVYEYTFVDIDGLRPELPAVGPLYSIIAYRRTHFATKYTNGIGEFIDQSSDSTRPELPGNSGPFGLSYFTDILNSRVLLTDEKPSFITPTVKLVTVRKYIE
jgi:hypothetical protein